MHKLPTVHEYGAGVTAAYEPESIDELDRVLRNRSSSPKFVKDGEPIELSDSFLDLLRDLVHALASGYVVTLVAKDKELTTQQAADILNVSRPYLIKLLDTRVIPYSKTGTHRRIKFSDLMQYKKARDEQRHLDLTQLTQLSEDLGLDT